MDAKDFLERAGRFAQKALDPKGPIKAGKRRLGFDDSEAAEETAPSEPSAPRPKVFDAYTRPGELKELGVLLMPLAEYHGEELGAVADALGKRGQPASFLVEQDHVEVIDKYLGDHPRILAEPGYDLPAIGTFDVFVAMNDWGKFSRPVYDLARARAVTSVAKVEGVQDFTDVDTGRIRLPYLAADHVLVQGQNDIDALNRKNLHIVGNANMEAAWNAGPYLGQRNGEVIINSNFTYGVLTEARDSFLESAIAAIEAAGFTPVISQHPADHELPESLASYRTERSMSSILPVAEAVVTRFSTVPFEAIAYGTPFVYFNPHHEKVPTFRTPDPAFEHVHTVEDLTAALQRYIEDRDTYRDAAEPYFRAQIDMTGTPSAERTAAAIIEILKS